jgi:hypothetical protein
MNNGLGYREDKGLPLEVLLLKKSIHNVHLIPVIHGLL